MPRTKFGRSVDRRTALKSLSVGTIGTVSGLSLLTTSSQEASAETVGFIDGGSHSVTSLDGYPYKWTDAESSMYGDNGGPSPEAKRAWSAGVQAEVVDGDQTEEAVIGVEVTSGMGTQFTEDMPYECKEIEGQEVEITYDEADDDDFVFRTDEDGVGAHEINGADDMEFATEAAESVVGYVLDLLDSTIGTTYNVAMDTSNFVQGVGEARDQTDTQGFLWNYVTNESRIYSGKKEASTSAYFQIRLDPDQRVSFDVRTTNIGREYANTGHNVTFTVGHPNSDDDSGIV